MIIAPRRIPALAALVMCAALVTAPGLAQGREITLAVLPLGSSQTSTAPQVDLRPIAEKVVEVVGGTGLYTTIDRSTDAAIEGELRKAESYRNFDSRVDINTTHQLDAAVLLLGVVERARMEPNGKRGDDLRYHSEFDIRFKLVNTQTGELIRSTLLTIDNAAGAGNVIEKKGGALVDKLPDFMKDKMKSKIDSKVESSVQRSTGVAVGDKTPADAIRTASDKLAEPLANFLTDSYGAILAASKKK